MAKKCGKCKPTECEECPEWIFTLADLIMCMMGLFVILWVLKTEGAKSQGNSDDNKAYVKMAAAIRDAFGYIPNPLSTDPVDIMLLQQKLEGDRVPRGPGEGSLTQEEKESNEGPDRQVTKIRDGDIESTGTAMLFSSGSAQPTPEMVKQVRNLANKVRGHRQIIVVKGHASLDDLPEGSAQSKLMELSLARAQAIADLLIEEKVAPETVRVQGASVFEPSKQRRYGSDAQAVNRRVEIDVTDQLVEDRQDTGKGRRKAAAPAAGH
jgi:outer membrane protein OmpA-like peptidoglycan-associated protein